MAVTSSREHSLFIYMMAFFMMLFSVPIYNQFFGELNDPTNLPGYKYITISIALLCMIVFFYSFSKRSDALIVAITKNYLIIMYSILCLLSIVWYQGYGTYFFFKTVAFFILEIMLCLAISSILNLRQIFRLIFISLIGAVLLSFIWVILLPDYGVQVSDWQETVNGRWRGIFNHKNTFGLLCGVLLPLVVLYGRHNLSLLFQFLVTIITVICIIKASSVTGYFAATFGFIGFFWIRAPRQMKYAIFPICFVVLVLAFLIDDVATTIPEFFGRDSTLSNRTLIWLYELDFISNSPFLGYGFRASYYSDSPVSLLDLVGGTAHSAHNSYIDIVLGLGFVGLSLFLVIVSRAFARGIRALSRLDGGQRAAYEGSLVFLISWLASGFGDETISSSFGVAGLGFLVLVALSKDEFGLLNRSVNRQRIPQRRFQLSQITDGARSVDAISTLRAFSARLRANPTGSITVGREAMFGPDREG